MMDYESKYLSLAIVVSLFGVFPIQLHNKHSFARVPTFG